MNPTNNDIFGIRRSTLLILAVAMTVGSFSFYKALGGGSTKVAGTLRVPSAAVSSATNSCDSRDSWLPTSAPSRIKTELTPIEQIQVGDRVLAESPTGDEDLEFGSEIIPADWRKLTLQAPKRDGTMADVVLLRPVTWLNEQHGKIGGTVFISVPECGINGNAKVLAIDPCPDIHSGKGRVVTGTFQHHAASTISLIIGGESEPIVCTGNHPFWSEDRHDFVRADSLQPGEPLRTASGLTTVESWHRDLTPTPVYNIDVHGAHVYHVGISGVLVHNGAGLSIANPCLFPEIPELGLGFSNRLDGFKKQFPDVLDYADLGLNPYAKEFPQQLRTLMDGAGVIRFDASGMYHLTGPNGVLTGPAKFNIPGSTNWELRTIFDNPALRDKTRIYLNGALSSFDELLRIR